MKKLALGAAIFSTLLSNAYALTPVQDPLMLRVRWLVVSPESNSHDNTISTIGGYATVNTNITPEIDISYFFTQNIALELITAVTRHQARGNGTAAGNINLGEVSLLPPTLTAQWHFLPTCVFNPYVGVGINYTYFFGVDPGAIARHISYSNSFGAVLQAGVNYNFNCAWHVNLDVKKVWINTDATVQLNEPPVLTTSIDINPWIIGIGLGYRFC